MNKKEIRIKLKMYTKILEGLGMSPNEACDFVSGIMNLGVAVRELFGDLKHGSSFFYIDDSLTTKIIRKD